MNGVVATVSSEVGVTRVAMIIEAISGPLKVKRYGTVR